VITVRIALFSSAAALAKGTAPKSRGAAGDEGRNGSSSDVRLLLRAVAALLSMHILVTGGAGFIGLHLVARLIAEGARVRVLDDLSSGRAEDLPSGTELIVADIADLEVARRAAHGVEAVFHLAAIPTVARSGEDWVRAHQVNAIGTVAILDAAARIATAETRIPVVYASSAAV